jgi:interleukin-1 receptor-associated kinase 1
MHIFGNTLGWSYNKGEPLLIYEFMTNGSLDQHLFQRSSTSHQRLHVPPNDTDILQWHTRYEIVRNIETGLHCVHNEHEPMVLHPDIKASNIMLDSNFRARLGDFGIACTVAIDKTSATGCWHIWLHGTRICDYLYSHTTD